MLFLPLLLLLGSATTLAAPAPQGPEHGISKMYLVICKDINLEPASKCITVYYLSLIPNDECHTLDASYDNTLSSFEINRMCCAFYDSPKCSNKYV